MNDAFLGRTLAIVCLVAAWHPTAAFADDAKDLLQGVWTANSMEVDGKSAPAAAVKRMQFTFKNGRLFIRGNFDDDREQECTYEVDPKKSPKHLDFTPPKQEKPILGIYEVTADELKVCLRHASSDAAGRPTEFATKDGSNLVLVVFKRQKK